MSPRHVKLSHPTNTDLVRNPMIGGSKGANIAQVTPDDLEEFAGANTFEGDLETETNPQGGIDKAEVRDRRRGPPQGDRDSGPRKTPLQPHGRLRMACQVESEERHAAHDAGDVQVGERERWARQDLRLLREMRLEDPVDELVRL